MALEKNVSYLDNWDDLIKKTKEIAEEVEREKEDRDVTRTFVDSQIQTAEEKDNQEEQAEYAKIYQKIADISAGGGTDLSDYLKKEDAAATYATKSEIPDLSDYATQQQLQEAVSDKATLDQVAALDQKVDAIDLTPYAKISDVSAEYAKKSEIAGMATEQYVQEQIAELVDGAPEELNSFKELSDALKDQGDAVSAINAVLATKADASTVYTKEQADAKFLTEHQDLTDYALKSEIPDVSNLAEISYVNSEISRLEEEIPSIEGLVTEQQMTEALADKATVGQVAAVEAKIPDVSQFITEAALEPYALKTDIPDVSGYALQSDVDALSQTVDLKANSADVYTKTQADEKFLTEEAIANLASKQELQSGLEAVEAQIPDTSAFITDAALEPYALKTEIPDVTDFSTKEEVSASDSSVLKNILGRIWSTKDSDPSKGCFVTKLVNSDGNLAEIFNESDGGGVIFADNARKLKTFVGVNDGGDPSTGIHAQIYSKNVSTNEGARLNINPAGMFYGVGASTPIDAAHELAVKGDIPSVEGLVDQETMTVALQDKATIEQVSTVDEKVDALDASVAEGYVPVGEYNALVDKVKVLQAYIDSFITVDPKKREDANDEIVNSLSDDNTSVVVPSEIKSIVYPETTKGLTVIAPLADDSSVKITSDKYFYLDNTSETGDTSTAIIGIDGATSATTCYLTGTFDTLTLTNISVNKSSSKNAAVVSNVVIPETNETNISISVALTDGATITNNSDKDVTINNQTGSDAEPTIYVVAPNSTVTVSGGQYGTFESTVGDNTLYINKNVHINTLVVKKGNVIVNDYEIESHIDQIQNDTEYTVTPKIIEVYNQSDWSKASSVPALYEVMNDLTVTNRIAPGIFGSSAKIKLNGHTVTCSDENASFLLRGSSHYIIENGTIIATKGYGIWLSGAGTVELKDCNVISEAEGGTHCLYIEKTNGKFITSGHCRFEITAEEKKYTLNYKDEIWTGGYHDGFLLGEGTEVVGQDVAASMSEPGGPVNMLPAGYHTESFEEDGKTIYRVVKDSE